MALPPFAAADEHSLAVLPFVFLSPVEGKESLSLGFADAIITSLGSLKNFLVLPTSAILRYPGGANPAQVSRELHVQHVLQGNIQKLGSRWRVTLQLHDATAGRTVFTSKYDFNLEDVFDIQDQICQCVADSLSGEFLSAAPRMRDRYSKDPYAYDEYLRGLKGSYSDTPEIMEEALYHLTQATERDPDFALAHAAIARVLVEKHRPSSIRAAAPASLPNIMLSGPWRSIRIWPKGTSPGLMRSLEPDQKATRAAKAIRRIAESPAAASQSRLRARSAWTGLLPLRTNDREPRSL